MNTQKILSCVGIALVVSAVHISAQPVLGVASVDNRCASGPTMMGGLPDTVSDTADAEGFRRIFDGKSLKGWWEGCGGSHATDKVNGGIWVADSTNQALYSMQSASTSGSVLTTNKPYSHYELIFDFWPSFGNDGGIFNRTPPNWKCYQTTLDYVNGSSIGGAYGENSYANHNIDPYTFPSTGGGTQIQISAAGNATSLTSITARNNPTSYGCPATGCTISDWSKIWDATGWNQIRVKFFGGLTANRDSVKMQAWIRKLSPAMPWVPTYTGALLPSQTDTTMFGPRPFGLQIHSGSSRWVQSSRGIWYRNIKVRPLDANGNPLTPSSVQKEGSVKMELDLHTTSQIVEGWIDADHQILVRDLSGRILEKFSGPAGVVHYTFANRVRGVLLIQVKTSRGIGYLRMSRI